ncbi:hypothetical protein [Kitasatospora sp. NPDC093806]|uniref:hypothetical protein n=1 Tax=Kitasatospora sp. NPDC093806 TaxID=3155075 RepID=UPI00341DB373
MDTSDVHQPIPRAGRILVVAAVLCIAPGAGWVALSGGSPIDGPLVIGSLVTTAPLFYREAAAFTTACLATGWGLLTVSLLGALGGLFVLAPAGIVLLSAASRSRPRPHLLPLLLGILVAASTIGLIGWVVAEPWIAPFFQ